tara:strand:+ start:44077 stop:44703 length:627 start_codon:yes stop_codon:yes gene_type:complete
MIKKSYIAIIDYKMSNLFSIKNALDSLGIKNIITSDSETILSSNGAILPGVGSFPESMQQLQKLQLIDTIKRFIDTGKPFMGICLGLQLLFTRSDEFGKNEGLGIINGSVQSFKSYIKEKPIPHVGWNKIQIKESNQSSKSIIDNENYFYFVHSYFVKPKNKNLILTETNYENFNFCSSIINDNIFACQFHPEKSGKNGLNVLKNFFI